MAKRDKREQAIRRNPKQVRYDDLHALLTDYGFDRIRGAGSHVQYRHPRFLGRVTLSPHGAFVSVYQVRQALDAIDTVSAIEEGSHGGL